MPKNDLSSRHFQRKISEFCELRIAPIASRRVLENIRPYLASLIIYRKSPPLLNGHIDWTMISQACGIEAELTAELKKQLRPDLDAIIRWLGASALFFLAFLPQFVEVDRGHVAMQIAFLGLVYTAIGVLTDSSYALAAGTAGKWLKRSPAYLKAERWVSGFVYIGLGLTAAFAGNQKK